MVYWCLTLTEEHTLSVFENRVLSKSLDPKRDGVRETRIIPRNQEL